MRRIDLAGKRFDHVVVEAFSHYNERAHSTIWVSRCDCGVSFLAQGNNLTSGNTKSCGCVHGLAINNPITHEQLLLLVRYEPLDGIFYRVAPGNKCVIGAALGVVDKSNGYVRVSVEQQRFWAHRLAWFYVTSVWPDRQIDHEDLNRANNRWLNLRLATQSQNNGNFPKSVANTTGFKGVVQSGCDERPFLAQIKFLGKRYRLGNYACAEDAALAYDVAARNFFGAFARTNFGMSG